MSRVSRIHRRDWDLDMHVAQTDVTMLGSASRLWATGETEYRLSMNVTPDEAQRLMNLSLDQHGPFTYVYRGSPSIAVAVGGQLRVSGVAVTADEAWRITHGEDPRDVLELTIPACGYRLRAVNDPLLGTT